MKCVFPILLLTLSLCVIPTNTQAKLTPAARNTMIETLTTLKKAFEMFKQKPTHKPAATPRSTPKVQELAVETPKALPQAKLTPAAKSIMIETLTTLKKAFKIFKQKPVHKPAVTPTSTPKVQELAVETPKALPLFSPNSDLPIKTMQEIVADAIDTTKQEKFGIAALIKAMREQALNEGNPYKHVFKASLPTAEKFLTFKGGLFDAKSLYEELHPETKKALAVETDKRDLSWFQKKKFLEKFLAANTLA